MNSINPSMRSDAKANRERILYVAREALTKDPAASLNSIAKAAKVGPGTLYRHFPTREALVVAVNAVEIESLLTLAHKFTAEFPPVEAFRRWCHQLIDHVVRQQGFRETLNAALSFSDREEAYLPVREAVAHILAACEEIGATRPDADATDLQLLLSFIWQIRTPKGERRAHRVVEIVIRGIST